MIKEIDYRIIRPHELANKLCSIVTRGAQTADKYFKTGYYGKYIILGAFLKVNAQRYMPGATIESIQKKQFITIELVNRLLKDRYGFEAFLPTNFSFFKTGWDRNYCPSEIMFLDQLFGMVGDAEPDILDHAELLVLGCIEHSRWAWHNIYSSELDRAAEVIRNVDMGNLYIQEITGIEGFFSAETIETTFKLK